MLVLVVPWNIYNNYANYKIEYYSSVIQHETVPALSNKDWFKAKESFKRVMEDWKKFKRTSDYFLNSSSLNDTNIIMNETYSHILKHDEDDAAACSSKLIQMLELLHDNEQITPGNVF